jgi:hypothetical protein
MDILEQKIKLQKLINELVDLGEDEEELKFWQGFFEAMNEEEREKLFLNLTHEKERLESLSSSLNL